MAKTIQFRAPIQENEARLVAGIADKGRRTQYELYAYAPITFGTTIGVCSSLTIMRRQRFYRTPLLRSGRT